MTTTMNSIPENVSDLVEKFLDVAQETAIDMSNTGSRQAELMYELDTLVSDFLDQNQLSSNEFNALEQQVLNSIAEGLIHEDNQREASDLDHDDNGDFLAESVFTAIDAAMLDMMPEPMAESSGCDAIDA